MVKNWSALLPVILLALAVAAAIAFGSYVSNDWQKKEYSVDIVSLNTVKDLEGSIEGDFIIGTGTIDGSLSSNTYYYVRAVYPEGTLIEKYDASTTYLVERDDIPPQIFVSYEINKWSNEQKYSDRNVRNLKVTITVPKNTIIKQFDASVK